MAEPIELADFLLIAEAVLGIPAEDLARVTRIPEADFIQWAQLRITLRNP